MPPRTKEGLGKLPQSLSSVAELLLFNSTENPYKKYSALDNLEQLQGYTTTDKDEDGIDSDPSSQTAGGLHYNKHELPSLGEEELGKQSYQRNPGLDEIQMSMVLTFNLM